jgi:hypothetical protein
MRLVPGAGDILSRAHGPLGWFGLEEMTAATTSLCTTLRGTSALAFGCSAPACACCRCGEFLCHGDRSKGGKHICPQDE